MKTHSRELKAAIDIAVAAGDRIIAEAANIDTSRSSNASHVYRKNIKNLSKNEVVTSVDRLIDTFITHRLKRAFPKDYIITEESHALTDYKKRKNARRVWLVDPIDGTAHFVNYLLGKKLRPIDTTFAVSIGLAIDKKPHLGVVYCPLRNELLVAEKGKGAYRRISNGPWQKMRVRTTRSFSNLDLALTGKNVSSMRKFKKLLHGRRATPIGPLVHRLIQVTGEHDVVATTRASGKEWDTIAADIIVHEAGGTLRDSNGKRLSYNKQHVKCYQPYFSTNKKLASAILRVYTKYKIGIPRLTLIGSISHSTPVYENGEIRERWGGGVMYGGMVAAKLGLPTTVITAGARDILPGVQQLRKTGIKVLHISRTSSNNFSNDYSKPKRVLRMRSIMKQPLLPKDFKKINVTSDVVILNPIYHEITPAVCAQLGEAVVILDVQGLTRETKKEKDGFYHLIRHRWNKLSDYKHVVDVLKMSDEDLENIKFPPAQKTIRQKLMYLTKQGFPIVILTRGSQSTLVAQKGEALQEVPIFKVRAIDTGGAGDSFNIGFTYGYMLHHDPIEGAAYGNAVASYFVSAKGAAGVKSIKEIEQRTRHILRKINHEI